MTSQSQGTVLTTNRKAALIIAIVAASLVAAIVGYQLWYTSNYREGFVKTYELKITSMTFTGTGSGLANNNTITLSVRNVGTSRVTISEIKVNDVEKVHWTDTQTGHAYDAGASGTVVVFMEPGSGWVSGSKYKVTLLSATGATVGAHETTA